MSKDVLEIGDFRIHLLKASGFRLDGGTMFGIVPRVLWERKYEPDGSNRIVLNVNSLLVESKDGLILIETGMGSKHSTRAGELYVIDKTEVRTQVENLGFSPSDIRSVVLSHLHFDHCGGSTYLDDGGEPRISFPNARYYVQKKELELALNPKPLVSDSYFMKDYVPLVEKDLVSTVDGTEEIAGGIILEETGGHTDGHHVVRIRSAGEEGIYLGDLVPMSAHLRGKWLVAWDMYPMDVYNRKLELLSEAAENRALLFFSHDPYTAAGVAERGNGDNYRLIDESIISTSP